MINGVPYELTAFAGKNGMEFYYKGVEHSMSVGDARGLISSQLGLMNTTEESMDVLSNLTGLPSAPKPPAKRTYAEAARLAGEPGVEDKLLETIGNAY